jgi:threonine-phosphate decarboxylase
MSHSSDHGGNIFDVARQLCAAPSEIADFSASINPLGLSPQVKSTIIEALDSLIHYPDINSSGLKQALADYHDLPPENLVIANGSTELIYQLPALLQGRHALIISPSFSEYLHALKQHQWEVDHFLLSPADNFQLDFKSLEQTLYKGYDALYLCNPANPGGTLYPRQVIEQILSLCDVSGTFLVLDEAFMDFCEEASAKHFIVGQSNCIVLRSMTKFFGIPGLRLGYSISNNSLAEQLDTRCVPWSVNTLAQVAGVAALNDTEHNRRTIEYVQRERFFLSEKLSEFSQLEVYPAAANFLLIEITGKMTSSDLKNDLLKQRIMIRDCSNFKGLSRHFFRIAVRTTEENRRLLAALENIVN